jgi:hypothetical protein
LSISIGAFYSPPYFDHISIYYVKRQTNIYFHWLNHLQIVFEFAGFQDNDLILGLCVINLDTLGI